MASSNQRPRGRPVSPRADYRRIASVLRERMSSGAWPPGTVLPSLRSLAASHGVGKTTLELAVNLLKREGWIDAEPRTRMVVKDPDESPALTQALILQVVASHLDAKQLASAHFTALQRGLEAGVLKDAFGILIASNYRFREVLPRDLTEVPYQGVLLVGVFRPAILDQYQSLKVPVVLVDQPQAGRKLHAVAVDNGPAAFDATSRLIALGHRRIAFLRGVQTRTRQIDPDSLERQNGYKRALAKAGLPADPALIFNAFSSDTPDSPTIQAVFRSTPGVTAVLAVDAQRARLVARAAGELGVSIPRDLSMVCFQGTPPIEPSFSGPRIDFEELGRRAGQLVIYPGASPSTVRVPAVWVNGKTMAPPRR